MKKLLALLLCTLLLLASCSAPSQGPELSSGIDYLRRAKSMHKCVSPSEPTMFSADDFDTLIGQKVGYIVVSALPNDDFGVISLRGNPIISGQTVAAESLGLLMFSPSGNVGDSDTFTFYCRDGGYTGCEITCSLTISDSTVTPTAQNKSFDAIAGIPRCCLLSEDFDIKLQTYAAHGSLKQVGSSVIYTANADYKGIDSFEYVAKDLYGTSPVATVYINVSANESQLTFCDMADNDAYYDAARMCLSGVMTYLQKDGKYYFEPSETVSRIDFVVMMMDALSIGEVYSVGDTVFLDDGSLTLGRMSYLAKAVELGIVSVGEGRFEPSKPITRSYAANLLSRALALPDAVRDTAFTDISSVPHSDIDGVQKALSAGVFSLAGDCFYPGLEMTRQDVAELLCISADYKTRTNP